MDARTMAARFIRLREVMDRTGFARSTVYSNVKKGVFPKGLSLGPSLTVWVEAEVEQWILDQIRRRDEINAAIHSALDHSNLIRMPTRYRKARNA